MRLSLAAKVGHWSVVMDSLLVSHLVRTKLATYHITERVLVFPNSRLASIDHLIIHLINQPSTLLQLS